MEKGIKTIILIILSLGIIVLSIDILMTVYEIENISLSPGVSTSTPIFFNP